jgi:hypothetical protein
MSVRFTQPAREVVVRAQAEARALGDDYTGTEHLARRRRGTSPEAVRAATLAALKDAA